MKTLVMLLAAALALPDAAHTQAVARDAVPGDSARRTIGDAERLGQRMLRPAAVDSAQTTSNAHDLAYIAGASGGTAQRKCVDVGDAPTVRSGDFVAGFGRYSDNWNRGFGKISWTPVPGSPKADRKDLIVTATRLDAETVTRIFTATSNQPHHFYPTGMRMPSVGRWLLVATTGNYWGCFILTVQ